MKNIVNSLGFMIFLLTSGTALTLVGIWGGAYDWFTGSRLTIILTLGSMLAKYLEDLGFPRAQLVKQIFAGMALMVGGHLLSPYFWPGRIYNLRLFVIFTLTVVLLWLQLVGVLWWQKKSSYSFQIFCVLPLTMLAGSLLSVLAPWGNFLAPALNAGLYGLLGASLIHLGLKRASRFYFNGGLGLFILILGSWSITFLFALPDGRQQGIGIFLLLFLNILFNKLKAGGK